MGLVQGGVQSLSRSLFGRLVPEGKNAEFFGFYNMMGKFATVLGPLLIAIVAALTHNERASIISLVLLFVVGGVLLWRVPAHTASLPDLAFEGRDVLVAGRAARSAGARTAPPAPRHARPDRGALADALRVIASALRWRRAAARRAPACASRAARRGRCDRASRAQRRGARCRLTQAIHATRPSANAQPRCCHSRRVDAELAQQVELRAQVEFHHAFLPPLVGAVPQLRERG